MLEARWNHDSLSDSRGMPLRKMLETGGPLSVADALRISLSVVGQLVPLRKEGVLSPAVTPGDVTVKIEGGRIRAAALDASAPSWEDRLSDTDSAPASAAVRAGLPPDERTSVWALGVLLYEMLAGEPPATAAAVDGDAPPDALARRADVPEELAVLVYRMLDADPDLRPQTLETVRAELQVILDLVAPAVEGRGKGTESPLERVAIAVPVQTSASTLTPFVGRERELTEVARRLADPECRLLMLVGSGGIGKSRLALQVAEQISGSFGDGVHVVPLGAVRSPAFIPLAVGNALDFTFTGPRDPKLQILSYLRDKDVLMVLDEFDRLLEGADFVTEVLGGAPGVKVLVTSRERLVLPGEWVFEVEGLEVPEEGGEDDLGAYDSVRLFEASAKRLDGAFVLDEETQNHVARICRLVEGIPLGIELAAGWTRLLSCEEIAEEIGKDIDFLATDRRSVPPRQRGMRVTLDGSWELLTEEERGVLARLSVFTGGFARNAAEEVAGATLAMLLAFRDKSLLQRDAFSRYRMHELLRQYLEERLGQSPEQLEAAKGRHCSWYAKFVEVRPMLGWNARHEVDQIEEELGNVQKAWDWALESCRLDDIDRFIDPIYSFCRTRGWHAAGEDTFGLAVRHLTAGIEEGQCPPEEGERVQAGLLVRQAASRVDLGDYRGCRKLLRDARGLIGETGQPKELALALRVQANAAIRQGEYEEARRLLEDVHRIGTEIHDRSVEADALQDLGNVAMHLARYGEAKRVTTEALSIRRALRAPKGIAVCLNTLGNIAFNSGQNTEAQRCYEEGLQITRTLGDRMGESAFLSNLGNIALGFGDHDRAKELHMQSLENARAIGFHRGVSHGLYALGEVCLALAEYDEAAVYLDESLALHERSGDRRGAAYSLSSLGVVWHERGDYERAQKLHERALAIFRELDVPRGIAVVLGQLGTGALVSGDVDRAAHHCAEGLKVAADIGASGVALGIVRQWARLSVARGNLRMAVELCSFVSSHEATEKGTRDDASELLSQLASQLPTEEFKAAAAKGRSRVLEDVVEELVGGAETPPLG
jgi:predicted ATPase